MEIPQGWPTTLQNGSDFKLIDACDEKGAWLFHATCNK